MRPSKFRRLIALTVILCMAITSMPAVGFASVTPVTSAENQTAATDEFVIPEDYVDLDTGDITVNGEPKSISEVTEEDIILEESDEASTTYDLGGGRKATIFYSYDVRYRDEQGNLVDIDPEFTAISGKNSTEQGESLSNYQYENVSGANKTYIPEELSESTPIIMEKENYSITMTPTGYLNSILAKAKTKGKLKEDVVRTIDNKNRNKKVTTVFGDEDSEAYVEYVSTNEGLKENIVLNEVPKKNEFTFKLKLKGLTYSMNEGNGGITLCDETTGEAVAFIEPPFMNDATGEAYSENLYYTMERKGNSDNYTLTLTVDEEYLNAAERVYPVTIDPALYWEDSSTFKEAYVNSGSPNQNYYGTSYQVIPSGRAASGNKYRTYIKFLSLRAQILGMDVISAAIELYENGDGGSGHSVRVFDIAEDWSYTNVTWNTVPSYNTPSLDSFTSSGTAGSFKYFDVTSWARDIAAGASNYGLVIRNYTESSTSYVEFYGSRSSSSAYRPVFLVEYEEPYVADVPTTAIVSIDNNNAVAVGTDPIMVTWSNIYANNLAEIQYKVVPCNSAGIPVSPASISYGTLITVQAGYSSLYDTGSANIPGSASLTDGYYAVYIRGLSTDGSYGSDAYALVHVDRTAPLLTTSMTDSSSYAYISWSVDDGTANDYVGVEIYVDGANYAESTSASGGKLISFAGLSEGEMHTITVIAYDINGNESESTEYFYVPYRDYYVPYIEALTLTHSDGTVINTNDWYTKSSGNFTIGYSGVSDTGSGIDTSSFKCTVYKNGDRNNPVTTVTSTSPSLSGGEYSGSFSLSMGSLFTESASYTFEVSVKDLQGNETKRSINFNRDTTLPEGSITVKDATVDKAVSELRDMVRFIAEANDKHSGVKSANLVLKNLTTNETTTLIGSVTESNNVSFDTRTLANGEYQLILTVTDNCDYTITETVNMTVDNRIAAPILTTSVTGSSTATIGWRYVQVMDSLASLQYSTDAGLTWNDVAIGSSKQSGTFTAVLPQNVSGNYDVIVRGVDTEGIAGREKTITCTIDATVPTVTISSLNNGILTGTINDDHLASWQVAVKPKDAEDTAYSVIFTGVDEVDNARIGIVDLSDTSYAANVTYTVKVTATDIFGNTSFATYDIIKDAAYESATLVVPASVIQRGTNQTYNSSGFAIGTDETVVNLTPLPYGSVKWFVNNLLVSTDAAYTDTLASKYTEGTEYTIAAQITDAAGNISYSADLIQNAATYAADWSSVVAAGTEKELTVNFTEPVVSFVLNAPSESSAGNAITYMAKTGSGEYQTIIPGVRTYINTLAADILTTGSITIKAIVTAETEWDAVAAASIAADILDEETFHMSAVENYVPTGLSAEEGVNYKTYIKWQTGADTALPSNIYYEVYRGTEPGFLPGVDTLAADDVRAEYWSEINVNFSEEFYYRVRAVKKDSLGNVIEASTFSDEMSASVVSYDEYTKRLGQKGYWAYGVLDLPESSVAVEKSKGNLVYSQTDAVVANELLGIELVRAYNSQATSKGAFGYGWSHSYDMELLSLCESDELNEGAIILKDGNGTLFWFDKNADGSYTSSLGKYVTLEKVDGKETITLPNGESAEVNSAYTITTKDKTECRFNSGGQIVYLEDNNGNIVLIEYDNAYGTISRIVNGQNASVEFTYDVTATGDPLLVRTVTMPDGQKMQYDYTSGKLVKVTKIGNAADTSDDICYEYSYGDNDQMSQIADAMGNIYGIAYDGYNRVTSVTYPATSDSDGVSHIESVAFSYATNGSDNTQTATTKLVDGSIVATETDEFEPSFGSRTKYTDPEGYVTEYTFQDNLPLETKQEVKYGELVNGIVQWHTTIKTTKINYNENQDAQTQKDATETIVECTYHTETGKTHLISELWERTASNVLIAHKSFEYDSHGNVTKVTDHINNTVTQTTYNYTGAGKGQIATQRVYLVKNGSQYLQASLSATYSYDSQNNLVHTQVETADNITVTVVITYDAAGKKVSETYTYTNNGTSEGSKSVAYTYDNFGRLIQSVTTSTMPGSSAVTQTESYTYDKNSNVLSQTDNDGTIHTYTYDASGNVVSETMQKGTETKSWTTSYAYEDVTIHTGIGVTETYTDAYVTTETLISGSDSILLSKTYQDALGRTIREVSNGLQTDYTYDSLGNIQSTYEVGLTASGAEDSETAAHMMMLYDSNGYQTTTIYNPVFESETFSTGADSIVTSSTYDEKGNMLTAVDALGNVTKYEYNSNGQVTAVTLANGAKTSYEYNVFDSSDNTTKTVTTYANGAVSETKYNSTGNVVNITDKGITTDNLTPVVKTYEYDSKGNMLKETYCEGNYKTYEYDAKGRLLAVNYYDAASGNPQSMRTEYTYDINDQILTMKDYTYTSGTKTLYRYTSYEYDQFGRLVSQAEISTSTEPTAAEITAASVTYEYDINDNLVKVNYPAIGSEPAQSLTYTYNAATQRLTSVKRTTGSTTTEMQGYTYYANGKINTVTGNGMTETYTYDSFGRPVSKVYTVGSTVKESHTYAYDKNHQITSETVVNNWPSSSSARVNETRNYTYDSIGQLVQSVATGTKNETVSYVYNAVGNRTSETAGGIETTYHYNSLNQLEIESNAQGSINYDYDDNGNLISKSDGTNTVTYTYDAANQMVGYTNGTTTQQNVYNGKGQRIKKTEGSSATNYFYDGSDLLYTTDGTGALKALQLYGANTDLFAAVYADNTMYFYTEDTKGSVVNLVDGSQNAVVSYTYTDYGETTESQGSSFNNEIRFTGGVYDETTGLYYLNARFYDPAAGRFLNPDSYRGEPADPQTLHLYAYCANNPVNLIDPTGHAVETYLDFVFLGISYAEFVAAPSATTFAYVVWDGVATIMPFVPGSYIAKGAKILAKADLVDDALSAGITATKGTTRKQAISTVDTNWFDFAKSKNLKIVNKSYAGKTYYLTGKLAKLYPNGVEFTSKGFPNFKPYAKKIVKVPNMIGDSKQDIKMANRIAGYAKTPANYVWHHCEDGVTMMLVPKDLHGAVRHTGGAALIRKNINLR